MRRVPAAIPAVQLATTASPVYTSAGGVVATISNLSLNNVSANVVSVSLYRVPQGGTASDANCFLKTFSLSPGQSLVPGAALGLNIPGGATLQALASQATAITLMGSVYETSGS